MQLPFVLQSAEVMKTAVALLEPHMEKSDASGKGSASPLICRSSSPIVRSQSPNRIHDRISGVIEAVGIGLGRGDGRF